MRAYLAARYLRRRELVEYARQLVAYGIEVQARWLLGLHEGQDLIATPEEQAGFAADDLVDIHGCDVLIAFTEPRTEEYSRGGRHVEFGVALGLGKLVHVVGPRENVFYCLPNVYQWPDWETFLSQALLAGQREAK